MRLVQFLDRFPDEQSCKDHFLRSRLEEGVKCKKCGGEAHWWLKSKSQFECQQCHFRTTLRSGTVLEHTKLPYRYWLMAIHLLTATKKTFSALEIQRQVGHKRYEPIWLLLHKLRLVMGKRDAGYQLSGVAEIDEGFFETVADKPEREQISSEIKKRGRGSQKQSKVLVAIESVPVPQKLKPAKYKHKPSRKAGYLKMQVMDELTSEGINYEVAKMADKNLHALTDGWRGYNRLKEVISKHRVVTVENPAQASKVFPWVHSAIGNAKKILSGIHHSVGRSYLQNYLNEFCYKFNRRWIGETLFERLVIASVSLTW